jgi:hypothetical protein
MARIHHRWRRDPLTPLLRAAPKPQKAGIAWIENSTSATAIFFIDPYRKAHAALVTRVWNGMVGAIPGCNLVFVSGDESKEDPYGRQIERATSIVHLSGQPARASCWCWPDEIAAYREDVESP